MTENIENDKSEKTKKQKQISYYKLKSKQCCGTSNDDRQKVRQLKDVVSFYDIENCELTEKLNNFEKFLGSVQTFQGGKYNDNVCDL